MAYNYEVKSVEQDDDYTFTVHESSSGLDIKNFLFKEDADKLAKHLNRGGGFSGWTPPFFLIDLSEFININDEFTGFFSS